ncbi:U6 snRNA-associated Sm-like protein LSm3 [Sarcoptes scabiei]|nr:U6 snRNA-associated Sm-like protein LSm3 [Sarcoptes scabiei]
MEQRKRIYIFLTFFVCTASLALLTVSLATHRWILAKPIRSVQINSSILDQYHQNSDEDQRTLIEMPKKFRGLVYFGLFQGTKILNYGLGDRTTIIWLKQEMIRNPNLMSFNLWLLTIVSISLAMIFGLVAAIFSIINTVMTPIEAITGVQGLYLWNILACIFGIGAAILWLVQFRTKLVWNVMTEDEQQDGWTSKNRASLSFSYYAVLVALSLHLLNVLLIYYGTNHYRFASGLIGRRQKDRSNGVDKHPEGLIMLY